MANSPLQIEVDEPNYNVVIALSSSFDFAMQYSINYPKAYVAPGNSGPANPDIFFPRIFAISVIQILEQACRQ